MSSGPYLTLSSLIIICIYLLLRCLLSDMSGSLFSVVIMLSPLISMILIYSFLLLSIIVIFLQLVWQNTPYTALTKPILFHCHHKGFQIVVYLDDILVLVHYKWTGKRAYSFSCSLLVALDYILIFLSLTLPHSVLLFLGVMLRYCPYVSIFPPDK